MTLGDALTELISALGATEGQVVIGWDVAQRWPENALEIFNQADLLSTTRQAESIECPRCDERCFLDVHYITHATKPTRAFIVCDCPENQGRIEIPQAHLAQWKSGPLQFAGLIAQLLNIECKAEYQHGQTDCRIGMLTTKKGRRWLILNISPPSLEINQHSVPLEEVLYFEGSKLTIDQHRITMLAENNRRAPAKRYTPSVENRETGKKWTPDFGQLDKCTSGYAAFRWSADS